MRRFCSLINCSIRAIAQFSSRERIRQHCHCSIRKHGAETEDADDQWLTHNGEKLLCSREEKSLFQEPDQRVSVAGGEIQIRKACEHGCHDHFVDKYEAPHNSTRCDSTTLEVSIELSCLVVAVDLVAKTRTGAIE